MKNQNQNSTCPGEKTFRTERRKRNSAQYKNMPFTLLQKKEKKGAVDLETDFYPWNFSNGSL